jgi:hypothetical protein
MRQMSFSATIAACRAQTKTVTRRNVVTWRNLRPGDRLQQIEKGQGLPKGSHVVKIHLIEVVDVRVEPLNTDHPDTEAAREGFPEMTWPECVEHISRISRTAPHEDVRRIEFRYVGSGES